MANGTAIDYEDIQNISNQTGIVQFYDGFYEGSYGEESICFESNIDKCIDSFLFLVSKA